MSLKDDIKKRFNVDRGRKPIYYEKEILFMTLTALYYGGQWDFMDRMFGMKAPTFERMTSKFISIISDIAFTRFVSVVSEDFTVNKMMNEDIHFGNYKAARFATG